MIFFTLLVGVAAVTLYLIFLVTRDLPPLSYDPEEDLSQLKEFARKRSKQKRKNKMMQAHIRYKPRKRYFLYQKGELHNRQQPISKSQQHSADKSIREN